MQSGIAESEFRNSFDDTKEEDDENHVKPSMPSKHFKMHYQEFQNVQL